MTAMIEATPEAVRTGGLSRLAGPLLVLGGGAFFVGGVTHPRDGGNGNKVQQLHDMLVDSSWYPSHAALLAAMALFACASSPCDTDAISRRASNASSSSSS